jgi:hypothetical protein
VNDIFIILLCAKTSNWLILHAHKKFAIHSCHSVKLKKESAQYLRLYLLCVSEYKRNWQSKRSVEPRNNSIEFAKTQDSSDMNTCRLFCRLLVFHRRQLQFFVECKKEKRK